MDLTSTLSEKDTLSLRLRFKLVLWVAWRAIRKPTLDPRLRFFGEGALGFTGTPGGMLFRFFLGEDWVTACETCSLRSCPLGAPDAARLWMRSERLPGSLSVSGSLVAS